MQMYEIITKKKQSQPLSTDEIRWFVNGYTKGSVPDYQASALLMAICLRGMTNTETAALTTAMAESGDMVDLSAIKGVKVDKHSTGGVGDKTTLITAPIVAACGVPVAKMSGRGLGHTGGTIDKLEALPGLRTSFSTDEFLRIVADIGLCVAGQSGDLAPADKKLYALRDATATVDSLPLIAASIMSKKIAAGADAIVLDVKCGSGAFMKTEADAIALAETMVALGEAAGRRVTALVTDMETPLGCAVGNELELLEALDILSGAGDTDLLSLCIALAAEMLLLSGKAGTREACEALAWQAVDSGRAYAKLRDMLIAQGGRFAYIANKEYTQSPAEKRFLLAAEAGHITAVNALAIGEAAGRLGAGRATKDDAIDSKAGITLLVKQNDPVQIGDALAILYTRNPSAFEDAEAKALSAFTIGNSPCQTIPLLRARVTINGVERLFT